MSVTPSSYSITMRLHAEPDYAVVGRVATTIAEAGGITTAMDVADSKHDRLVLDVTCSAIDSDHSGRLVQAVEDIDGVTVHKVSDRTFLLHLGGKIEVNSKVPLKNRDDLAMAYTPGVGRVSLALAAHPEDVAKLTIKGNSVAVVTDGSAVLGLGNIGPGAAMPVMEGKAALFKRFADIDAWPICLASQDVDEIVRAVEMIAPGFGGINLEDIAAPRCFEIEARLRKSLDIPVFHDDQHGTAIVVLAALHNALRVVRKSMSAARIVVAGGGAAGSAIVALLLADGAEDVVVWDREGLLSHDDDRSRARQARAGVDHQPAQRSAARSATGSRAPTCSSASAGRACSTRCGSRTWPKAPSSSRSPTRTPRSTRCGSGEVRRRRRVRPVGLSQPDQQRARVPRSLPWPARRPGLPGHHRHAAPCGARHRCGGHRRGAARRASSSPASSTPTCRARWPRRSAVRAPRRSDLGPPHQLGGEQSGQHPHQLVDPEVTAALCACPLPVGGQPEQRRAHRGDPVSTRRPR